MGISHSRDGHIGIGTVRLEGIVGHFGGRPSFSWRSTLRFLCCLAPSTSWSRSRQPTAISACAIRCRDRKSHLLWLTRTALPSLTTQMQAMMNRVLAYLRNPKPLYRGDVRFCGMFRFGNLQCKMGLEFWCVVFFFFFFVCCWSTKPHNKFRGSSLQQAQMPKKQPDTFSKAGLNFFFNAEPNLHSGVAENPKNPKP